MADNPPQTEIDYIEVAHRIGRVTQDPAVMKSAYALRSALEQPGGSFGDLGRAMLHFMGVVVIAYHDTASAQE